VYVQLKKQKQKQTKKKRERTENVEDIIISSEYQESKTGLS
jgi:hypothetical protein